MKFWWPTISIILGSVVTALTPTVQHLLGQHPVVTSIIAGVIAVITHWLPSPNQQPPVQ